MRFGVALLALFLAFNPRIAAPENFTPRTVAQDCQTNEACVKRCHAMGRKNCEQQCTVCR